MKSFNALSGRQIPLTIAFKEPLLSKRILVIRHDKAGDIWLGTEDSGLFWYQASTGQCFNFTHTYSGSNSIPSNYVRDIFLNNNEIWIGTRNGLSILNKTSLKFTNYSHRSDDKESLSHNTVWKIMKDAAGSMWVATYAGGINIYNPIHANFTNIRERVGNSLGLNQPLVSAIFGDNKGIWVGTDGGGLNFIDKKSGGTSYFSVQDIQKNKTSNIVKSIVKDFNNNLWIGTLDGLAKLNPATGTVEYENISPGRKVANNRINALLVSENGIWLGTDVTGLKFFNFNKKIKEYISGVSKTSIGNNHINALLKDGSKGVWIATNDGLNYLNLQNEVVTIYRNNPSKISSNSNVINAIFRDSKNQIWLGSRYGLQLFNKDLAQNVFITEAQGLADDVVQGITEDSQGNLWVSTNNGISRINFKRRNANLKPNDYQIVNFTSLDGLASNQWMPNAVFASPKGEIYFGGVNGVSYFQPNTILRNKYPPVVVITDFLIHDQSVNLHADNSPLKRPIESTKSIVLKHTEGFISFKFSALNYINPLKNFYAYKMEGLKYNEDWNFVRNQRMAVYTGLEPGNYIFSVKAANNDGVWNNTPKSIKITILPPFWLTWWAYTLYTLLILTILYFVIRFFNRQAKLERDLYYEHLQFERQQELYQMKMSFFTNISHEIRTPLTLILAPLEKLINEAGKGDYINKQLTTIHNNANRLLKLVNELMDFRKTETGNMALEVHKSDITDFAWDVFGFFEELAEAKNIDYGFVGLDHVSEIWFDHNQMEKVLCNLLSNAFKFTNDGGRIQMVVTENEQAAEISIIDNGAGIPYEDQDKLFTNYFQGEKYNSKHGGTGIGLAFSKSIVNLHKGQISFRSIPEGGAEPPQTAFTVSLLKGNHFSESDLGIGRREDDSVEIAGEELNSTSANLVGLLSEHKSSILVVEDNKEVRDFIISCLADAYTIIDRENGKAGFEAAISEIPDLVITDVMMPEMDGIELCAKIKSDERTSHIPVILLTARAAEVHQISGLERGADSYISKPFNLQVLQLNIRNLLASRAAMQKRFSQQITLQPSDVIIPDNDGKFLTKLIAIIENKMEDPDFSVPLLVKEIGMSKPVLYRKVKALTNLSIADFIKSLRLKRAAMLLAQNKMRIADVAYAVGFNDRKYFSKEFRKFFGDSPTSYLLENSTDDNN